MSKRDKIQDELSAYLDGELNESDAKRVQEALSKDPALARRLDRIRTLRQMVLSTTQHKAPDTLVETILQQAERNSLMSQTGPVERGGKLRWLGYGGLVAALVMLAAVMATTVIPNLFAPNEGKVGLARLDEAGHTITRPPRRPESLGRVIDPDNVTGRREEPAAPGKSVVPGITLADDSAPRRGRGGGVMKRADVFAKTETADDDEGSLERDAPPSARLKAPREASTVYVVINTTAAELAGVQRNVEKILVRNDVQLMISQDARSLPKNFFLASRPSPSQVQYEFQATPSLNAKILDELVPVQLSQAVEQQLIRIPRIRRPQVKPARDLRERAIRHFGIRKLTREAAPSRGIEKMPPAAQAPASTTKPSSSEKPVLTDAMKKRSAKALGFKSRGAPATAPAPTKAFLGTAFRLARRAAGAATQPTTRVAAATRPARRADEDIIARARALLSSAPEAGGASLATRAPATVAKSQTMVITLNVTAPTTAPAERAPTAAETERGRPSTAPATSKGTRPAATRPATIPQKRAERKVVR